MAQTFDTALPIEKAIMVGIITPEQKEQQVFEFIEELRFLIETAGALPDKVFLQKMDRPIAATFIGTGKLDTILEYITENEIKLVVFDDELSPTQLRNLENTLKCRILDRTNLILDIFAQRAKTSYAKTQVELAQYQYLLPRLTRMWTHLERQRGGIGLRGPGETEIETDRRVIRQKIASLKEDLVKIDKQMMTQRRARGNLVRLALVGYTNVGKSTIMNMLSKSEVLAENKLFATLDTTVRKVIIDNLPFLLSDTVGFIRKLPTHLVESFKSTLDEVREADILLHIVDISHPDFEQQIATVHKTLQEIKASDKKVIMVFNKIDSYTFDQKEEDDLTPASAKNFSLEEWKNSWMAKNNSPSIFISAKEKTNVAEFKALIYTMVKEIHTVRYPFDNLLYPDA